MLFKNSTVVFQISKFLLILLFTYAGCTKLIAHYQFAAQLRQVALLQNFAGLLSVSLPVIELITALCLVFDSTLMGGLILSAILMTGFTMYVGTMLLFSSTLPCSCGGVIAQMTWKQHSLFNLFFLLLSWNTLINYYKKTNQIISVKSG
jgi:putative oxidoreductase